MVVAGPGFERGRVVSGGFASLIDVAPTILACGGVEPPEHMRGRPLQELASGEAENRPGEVFAQISESQVGRCIRNFRWKYSVSDPEKDGGRAPSSDRYVEEFLYDLEADPHERTNLVREPSLAETRAALAETLKRRTVEAGEERPEIVPAG
jgi:uncharacterized sulfatase